MPDQIVRLDGVEHRFPSDFTKEDIQKALGSYQPAGKPLPEPSKLPSLLEMSQPRPHGGFTMGEEEGVVSRTIRGMQQPEPWQQLAIDVQPLVHGAVEALPNALATKNPIISQPNLAKVAAGTKAVVEHPVTQAAAGAAIGAHYGGPLGALGGAVLGPEAMRGREMMRVFGKLSAKLQEASSSRAEPQGAASAAAKPSGGYSSSLGAVLDQLDAEAATAEGTGERPLAPYERAIADAKRATGSVPLDEAVSQVHQAAPKAKLKLTAEEFQAATRMVQQGKAPGEVMEGVVLLRALKASTSFKGLPTTEEMEADMEQRAVSGQKSLMPVFGPKPPGGNPFR